MALEQITFNIGAFNDSDASGNNYFVNKVFEVKNQSDNTFATIYTDASGATQIPQNGIDNISNSRGECNFYIDDGDFYLEVDSQQKNFNVGKFKTDFANIDDVKSYSKLSKLIGQRITTGEYHAGTGYGGASYDVVTSSSVTPNDIDIIQGVADSGAAIVLRFNPMNVDADKLGLKLGSDVDNSPILQAAIDIAGFRGSISSKLFNPYFSSSVIIDSKPVKIKLASPLGVTWIYTGTEDFITVKNTSRIFGGSIPQEWVVTQQNGFELEGLTIEGNFRSNIFDALVFLGVNDDTLISNVNFYNVKGSCIRWGDRLDSTSALTMRESTFSHVEMKNCGYDSGSFATSRAVCDMYKDAGNGGDNFNNLTFDTFEIVYPRWKGFIMENNFTINQFRKFKFLNCFFHGNKSLSGNDANGEPWSNTNNLIDIYSGVGAECREIEFIDSKLLEHQDNSAGIYCGNNSGLSWKGGTIEGYAGDATSRVGIRFEGANTSFVGDITSQALNFGKGVVDVISMNTNQAVSLGYFSRFDNSTGAATVTTTSDKSSIEDLNLTQVNYTKSADLNPLDSIPITPFATISNRSYIKSINLTLESGVTSNPTNNALFSVLLLSNSGATLSQVDIDTAIDSIPSRQTVQFPTVSAKQLLNGYSIAIRVTKRGSGVTMPSGCVTVELSDCIRYVE